MIFLIKVTDVMTQKRALKVTDVLTHPGNRCPDICHIAIHAGTAHISAPVSISAHWNKDCPV